MTGSTAQTPTNNAPALAVIAQQTLAFMNENGNALSVPAPFANDIVLIEDSVVAGSTHVENIEEVVAKVKADDRLRFERQPDNPYDEWAIRVFAGKDRIGFVSAEQNEILARLMDGGKHVFGVVIAIETIGSWNRIHMEVHLDD